MRSFSRVVQTYSDSIGAGTQEKDRRRLAQFAAADLNEMFATHNWRHYEREVSVQLWGTTTVTLSSVSGTMVKFTDTADQKWVNQDLILTGDTTPYTIVRINDTNSFIIDPEYTGSSISSGTTATIRQVRCGLPSNFGSLLDPLLRGTITSSWTSPHELAQNLRGNWSSGYCHTVQNNNLILWPAESGQLYFRYKYQPNNLFEYGMGTDAIVQSVNKRDVIGSGTYWTQIPDSGTGAIFESHDNITRGFPVSHVITKIHDDDLLTLNTDWKTPIGTAFPYMISSDLDLPPYLVQYMIVRGQYHAGKRNKAHVYQTLLAAMGADSAIQQRITRTAQQGVISVVSGSRS